MALLFGCRHSEQDHIYKEEVEECLRSKALSHAYTAYSRDNKFKKVFFLFSFKHIKCLLTDYESSCNKILSKAKKKQFFYLK